ncbi:hypothetical protein FB451DRAFT_1366121 [Mycena latifolia]|nr:hypothetical protein FB451DRAFT_1366121 [Mycena latifolia]
MAPGPGKTSVNISHAKYSASQLSRKIELYLWKRSSGLELSEPRADLCSGASRAMGWRQHKRIAKREAHQCEACKSSMNTARAETILVAWNNLENFAWGWRDADTRRARGEGYVGTEPWVRYTYNINRARDAHFEAWRRWPTGSKRSAAYSALFAKELELDERFAKGVEGRLGICGSVRAWLTLNRAHAESPHAPAGTQGVLHVSVSALTDFGERRSGRISSGGAREPSQCSPGDQDAASSQQLGRWIQYESRVIASLRYLAVVKGEGLLEEREAENIPSRSRVRAAPVLQNPRQRNTAAPAEWDSASPRTAGYRAAHPCPPRADPADAVCDDWEDDDDYEDDDAADEEEPPAPADNHASQNLDGVFSDRVRPHMAAYPSASCQAAQRESAQAQAPVRLRPPVHLPHPAAAPRASASFADAGTWLVRRTAEFRPRGRHYLILRSPTALTRAFLVPVPATASALPQQGEVHVALGILLSPPHSRCPPAAKFRGANTGAGTREYSANTPPSPHRSPSRIDRPTSDEETRKAQQSSRSDPPRCISVQILLTFCVGLSMRTHEDEWVEWVRYTNRGARTLVNRGVAPLRMVGFVSHGELRAYADFGRPSRARRQTPVPIHCGSQKRERGAIRAQDGAETAHKAVQRSPSQQANYKVE